MNEATKAKTNHEIVKKRKLGFVFVLVQAILTSIMGIFIIVAGILIQLGVFEWWEWLEEYFWMFGQGLSIFIMIFEIITGVLVIGIGWIFVMLWKKTITDTNDHTALYVCSIIFMFPFGMIAAIICLTSSYAKLANSSQTRYRSKELSKSKQEQLKEWHQLYKDGVISEKEYNSKKKALMK